MNPTNNTETYYLLYYPDQGSTGIPVTQGLTNAATPVVVNTAQVTAASGTLGNYL